MPNIDAPVCVIKFRLPSKDSDPNGYPWVVSGNGRLDVFLLNGKIVPGQLTWNNKPARSSNSPIVKIIVSLKSYLFSSPPSDILLIRSVLQGSNTDILVLHKATACRW